MIKLRVALTPNPRLAPLAEGQVSIPGVAGVEFVVDNPARLHSAIIESNDFDFFEFSLSAYLAYRDRPARDLGWTALPVFMNRSFLILGLWVRGDAGIGELGDLRSKRVGVPDFGMTAAIWLRLMLRKQFGVTPDQIEWVNGRRPGQRHTSLLGIEAAPPGVSVSTVPDGSSLDELIHAGALDAGFGDQGTAQITPGPDIHRMFDAAAGRRLFTDFMRQWGVLPTSHVILAKTALADDLIRGFYQACEASKQESYRRARASAAAYLLFPDDDFAAQERVFGADPYPCGLEDNRRTLEFLAEEMLAEGMIGAPPDLPSLFADPAGRG